MIMETKVILTSEKTNPYQEKKGWGKVKLGDICKLKNGFAFKSSEYKTEGVPIIRISDIKEAFATCKSAVKIHPKSEYEDYLIENGDILIAMSGATTGKFGIFKDKVKAYQNQRVGNFKLIDNNVLYKSFLFYQLHSLKRRIEKDAYGGAQPNISSKKIEEMEIIIASLPEQCAIVSKIEQLFSELDNGIANLKLAQAQLKVYRQAVLKKAFEGELTREWREQQTDLPEAKDLLEQIQVEREESYNKKLDEWKRAVKEWEVAGKEGKKPAKPRKSKENEPLTEPELDKLPKLPKKWEWTKIGQVSKVGTGVTPLKKRRDFYEGGTIPWVTSGALNESYVNLASDYVTDIALKETNLKIHPKNTLLIALYGEGKTRGKCSELLIEATTNQASAAIVQERTEEKIRSYLKWFLTKNYDEIRIKSSSGVQPNLNLGIIENTVFPLCSLLEQHSIVTEIETRLSVCDKVEQDIEENLKIAEALRQSILKRAFEGKLLNKRELEEVHSAPDWEPAELLLERIRAEKAGSGKKGKA
ncbi:MAG: restriction endonuclease [Methanococcoides sp.]|nr:restriction endonuclease [Methanococcoides sp.]